MDLDTALGVQRQAKWSGSLPCWRSPPGIEPLCMRCQVRNPSAE